MGIICLTEGWAGRPCQVMCPISTGVGVLVMMGVGVSVGGAQVLSSTDTLAALELATARSRLPSRLKSLTATEYGPEPAPKLVGAPKPPIPSPSSTDTLLEV